MLSNDVIIKTNLWRAGLISEKGRKFPVGCGLGNLELNYDRKNDLVNNTLQ